MIKYFCDMCGDEFGKYTHANAFITIIDPETGFCKKIEIFNICGKCLDKIAEVFNIDKKIIEKCRRGEK